MSGGNKKKSEQLGMAHGTAAGRLRKLILFDLVIKSGLGNCHHCDEPIVTVRDLSIEHKVPWLDSEDPVGLFFDLDNIAFSHLSCNVVAIRTRGPETDPNKGIEYCGNNRKLRKPWRARFWTGDKFLELGYFATREKAVQARREHLETWRK